MAWYFAIDKLPLPTDTDVYLNNYRWKYSKNFIHVCTSLCCQASHLESVQDLNFRLAIQTKVQPWTPIKIHLYFFPASYHNYEQRSRQKFDTFLENEIQSNLIIRNKMVLVTISCDQFVIYFITIRNNFRVTKKFLLTKFNCTSLIWVGLLVKYS